MSFDRNEELFDYEILYSQDGSCQKIFYELKEENNTFKMIYESNEERKSEKLFLKEFNIFHPPDDKEYSGDEIRILDEYFIKSNKNKCKLIYKNKKYELKEYFEEIDNNYKNIIKLKLYGINNISDLSRMFYGCYYLSSFSEYQNQQNINDLKDIFPEDNSYTSINEEIKSNDSRFTEDNNSGLIIDLNKEDIDSTLLCSSIYNNETNSFFSKINSFQNNIKIPLLKGNKIFKIEKMFYGCFF